MKKLTLGKIKSVSKVVNTRNVIQIESAKGVFYVRLGDLACTYDYRGWFTRELNPSSEAALLRYIDGMFTYVNDSYHDVRYV